MGSPRSDAYLLRILDKCPQEATPKYSICFVPCAVEESPLGSMCGAAPLEILDSLVSSVLEADGRIRCCLVHFLALHAVVVYASSHDLG